MYDLIVDTIIALEKILENNIIDLRLLSIDNSFSINIIIVI